MTSYEKKAAIENLLAALTEKNQQYREPSNRDDILSVKKTIRQEIRDIMNQIAELNNSVDYQRWFTLGSLKLEDRLKILRIFANISYYRLKGYHIKQELLDLFLKFPNAPLSKMGFPSNWKNEPIWR